MADPHATPEPEEITAYRTLLKDAARIKAAADANPDRPLPGAVPQALDGLQQLQQRVTERAQETAMILANARDFKDIDWSRYSAKPRTRDQALAVLAADNLADFRSRREQLSVLSAAAAPLAPIDAEAQQTAARTADHLIPARMLKDVPLPQLHAGPTQEDIARRRVFDAQQRAEHPALEEIKPEMQQRANEPLSVPRTPVTTLQTQFEQRQRSETAIAARRAQAMFNETPHNQMHAQMRADNEGAAALNTGAPPPAQPPEADPAPAHPSGYIPFSAGIPADATLTPEIHAALLAQRAEGAKADATHERVADEPPAPSGHEPARPAEMTDTRVQRQARHAETTDRAAARSSYRYRTLDDYGPGRGGKDRDGGNER